MNPLDRQMHEGIDEPIGQTNARTDEPLAGGTAEVHLIIRPTDLSFTVTRPQQRSSSLPRQRDVDARATKRQLRREKEDLNARATDRWLRCRKGDAEAPRHATFRPLFST